MIVLLPEPEKNSTSSRAAPEARLKPTPRFQGEQARPGCWDEMTYTECAAARGAPKHQVR